MVNATPDARLRIHPWQRPIPRRPGEVQFGLLPEGPIVTGLTHAEVDLLDRLDGSRSLLTCFREAAACGVDTIRLRELIDLLVDLGLVESLPQHRPTLSPALGSAGGLVPTSWPGRSTDLVSPSGPVGPAGWGASTHSTSPAQPAGPAVIVDGTGPLAERLCTLLRRDLPVRVASAATHESIGATGLSPSVLTVDDVATSPPLVVLIGAPALDPRVGDRWLASGTAHLPVSAAGRRTTIGPLVEGPAGPCLWCLDLYRADRDGAWPTVMAQLCPADATELSSSDPPDRLDLLAAAELHLTAGSIAAFAQSVLGGPRPPPGISIDICLPWPRIDHRRWEVHPRCPRHDDRRQGPDGHRVDGVGAVA